MVGAQSVLFATSLSLVAKQTLSGHSQMRFWFTYVIAAGMLSLSVFWINQLTQVANAFCSTAMSKDQRSMPSCRAGAAAIPIFGYCAHA